MARMSIDDMFLRDPRVAHLAELCGWSVRETRGALLDVWAICYDQMTPMLSVGLINITAGNTSSGVADFAKHLLESELATVHRSTKLVICGVEERIKYLIAKKESGRQGGLNSARSRSKDTKQNHVSLQPVLKQPGSTPQALGNPVVPDVVVVVVPDVDVDPEEKKIASLPSPSPTKPKRGTRPREITGVETDVALRVLAKLGERNGTKYSGSVAHVGLITARLRDGLTERDLRAIIAFCAEPKSNGGRGWQADEKMRDYLRPETLFGPSKYTTYIDGARSWAQKRHLVVDDSPVEQKQQQTPMPLVASRPSAPLMREVVLNGKNFFVPVDEPREERT